MSEIVHVVLVEWRDGADPAEADTLVDRHLAPLPGVLTIDRGPSVSTEGLEGGFDWALVIRFASEEALAAYLPHPEHVIVGTHLQASSTRLVVLDLAARPERGRPLQERRSAPSDQHRTAPSA